MPVTYVARTGKRRKWMHPLTWQPPGIPTDHDHVVIPPGAHVPKVEPGQAWCATLTIIQPKAQS